MVLPRDIAVLCLNAPLSITKHLTLLKRQHPISVAVMEVEFFDNAPRILTVAIQVGNIEEVKISGQCDRIRPVDSHAVGGKLENGMSSCKVCKVRRALLMVEERRNCSKRART